MTRIAFLSVILCTVYCSAGHEAAPEPAKAPLCWAGRESKQKTQLLQRILLQDDLDDMWKKLGRTDDYPLGQPWQVYFRRMMVIAFFWGEEMEYRMYQSPLVVEDSDGIRIRYEVIHPQQSQGNHGTPPPVEKKVQHFMLVLLPNSNKSIIVEEGQRNDKFGAPEKWIEKARLAAIEQK